jgi:DNA-binding NarL/FixJ family response regulator
MIRVVVVDDHPALRAGLRAVLNSEPGIACLGESDGRDETLWPLLERTDPDVVILDYHLPQTNGLALCHRLKRRPPAPQIILYSAFATPSLVFPASIAGADALLDKLASARELLETIRLVFRGDCLLPAGARTDRADAYEQVAPEHRPILALLRNGVSPHDIADALMLEPRQAFAAIEARLERLRPEVPTDLARTLG